MAREITTTEALMTDPTTEEGRAYWQQRHDYEAAVEKRGDLLHPDDVTVVKDIEGRAVGYRADISLAAKARAARQFRDDIAAALDPGRWRGFDGPDGVSKDEVIADVAAALERYDQATGAAP